MDSWKLFAPANLVRRERAGDASDEPDGEQSEQREVSSSPAPEPRSTFHAVLPLI